MKDGTDDWLRKAETFCRLLKKDCALWVELINQMKAK
jgi:hypothetical protein